MIDSVPADNERSMAGLRCDVFRGEVRAVRRRRVTAVTTIIKQIRI
jgi:hypothetical protein